MDEWNLLLVTVTLVVAGGVLIGFGVAGVGGSLLLGLALLLVGGVGLGAAWELPERFRPDADWRRVGHALWLAPTVAGLVVVSMPATTPGELQTVGAVVGLVGMANYFLRPVYLFAYDLYRWLARSRSGR